MIYIKKNILEKELFYEDTLVLKYHIEYPSINGSICENSIKNFNIYNKNLAFNLKEKSENELYNEAVESYKYNKENGYPIMIYEVYRSFEVTYNINDIISLYIDEYIFSVGAHGNTIRTSQTWNLCNGTRMCLEDFFKNDPYFMLEILRQINDQISKEPEIYFENACKLVLETFNPANYYLTMKGIVIYFQQYDIAPYSSGIRNFTINIC